jgi:hypothetical protein
MSDKLTPEQALAEMARVYMAIMGSFKSIGKAGKWIAYAFAGILTFIVLGSQAWDAVTKFFHAKIGG